MTAPNMALQRTRRPRIRSGRSLRSLGSPLNARSLGGMPRESFRTSRAKSGLRIALMCCAVGLQSCVLQDGVRVEIRNETAKAFYEIRVIGMDFTNLRNSAGYVFVRSCRRLAAGGTCTFRATPRVPFRLVVAWGEPSPTSNAWWESPNIYPPRSCIASATIGSDRRVQFKIRPMSSMLLSSAVPRANCNAT